MPTKKPGINEIRVVVEEEEENSDVRLVEYRWTGIRWVLKEILTVMDRQKAAKVRDELTKVLGCKTSPD